MHCHKSEEGMWWSGVSAQPCSGYPGIGRNIGKNLPSCKGRERDAEGSVCEALTFHISAEDGVPYAS